LDLATRSQERAGRASQVTIGIDTGLWTSQPQAGLETRVSLGDSPIRNRCRAAAGYPNVLAAASTASGPGIPVEPTSAMQAVSAGRSVSHPGVNK
jgi:hypothetical protein